MNKISITILTNREKLEYLFQEYEKKNNHQLDKEENKFAVTKIPLV